MSSRRFDLVVVGSGPGGYVAAIRASQLGMKVAVVERAQLGGVCLDWGCIPTKALLHSAEIYHLLQHLEPFGFSAGDVQCDFTKLVARSRKVAKRLTAGVKHLLRKNAIEVVPGHARLAGAGCLRVADDAGEQELQAPHIVLGTGARPRSLPGVEPDGEHIWTYKEAMIPAVGIAGNVEDLGLETTAVRVEDGHIVTNDWLATDEPGIYAIGDVAGPPWLAHKASQEGVLCVEKIAGIPELQPLDASRIPACTYCRPQLASVGLTEQQAVEAGAPVRVGRFPFRGNGKATALGESEGLVKTVFDADTGELLGAHMFGNGVTELIQGFALARNLETTEAELMQTIFPHPTLSEAMHESVLDAFGRALHI